MANLNQNTRIQKVITFTPTLYQMASQKAKKIGVAFPEYVRHLLLNDVQTKFDDGMPLLSDADDKNIGKSFSDIKKGNYTVLKTKHDIENFINNL